MIAVGVAVIQLLPWLLRLPWELIRGYKGDQKVINDVRAVCNYSAVWLLAESLFPKHLCEISHLICYMGGRHGEMHRNCKLSISGNPEGKLKSTFPLHCYFLFQMSSVVISQMPCR